MVWMRVLIWFAAATLSIAVRAEDSASVVESDEVVILFPTAAHQEEDSRQWLVPIHGWIHEPEEDGVWRGALLREIQEPLQLAEDDPRRAILNERLRLFLVDNERGKRIGIRLGGTTHVMPASDKDGHFVGEIRIGRQEAAQLAPHGRLRVRVQTAAEDQREFIGEVHLLPFTGRSIVSDLDDTVKISEVTDKKRLIENAFVEPFRPVPGMSGLYRRWCDEGASLHFVSNGPWQFYAPLSSMLATERFPAATFDLRRIRLKDASLAKLFEDPMTSKLVVLETWLRRFPKRRFVLIGDSGEKDPEVYGELARRFPGQIERILIRQVTKDEPDDPRYTQAFRDVPRDIWQLFAQPSDVETALPALAP